MAVRLLARRPVHGQRVQGSRAIALTEEEIAIAAGLPLRRVREISGMLHWRRVEIGEARLFCEGCRFDPLNSADRNRARAYFRTLGHSRPTYLVSSPQFRTRIAPMMRAVKKLNRHG